MKQRKAGKLSSFKAYQKAVKEEYKKKGLKSPYTRQRIFQDYAKKKTASIKGKIKRNKGDISKKTAAEIISFGKELEKEVPKMSYTVSRTTAEHQWKKINKRGDEILVELPKTRKETKREYHSGIDENLRGLLSYINEHPKAKDSPYIAEGIIKSLTLQQLGDTEHDYWEFWQLDTGKFWQLVDILEEYNMIYAGKVIKEYISLNGIDPEERIEDLADKIIDYYNSAKKSVIKTKADAPSAQFDF